MRAARARVAAAVLCAALAGAAFAASDVRALLAAADEAYARRDEPGALDTVREKLAQAEKLAPDDFEVLWRQARLQFWIGDDPAASGDQERDAGRLGWQYGDRAARAAPNRVEGWYFGAAGVGIHALGIGTFRALREGIEGKFKDRLRTAEKLDPGYMSGGIQTAWGRFYSKAPWPKFDARKSERALLAALQRNPDNVRAHVYLAELYDKRGDHDRAKAELDKALAHPPGRYDAPEERRMQEIARRALAKR